MSGNWQHETDILARNLASGNGRDRRETAERMIALAVRVGDRLDYPVPVVTEGDLGRVGAVWDRKSGSLGVGYGLATGLRDA